MTKILTWAAIAVALAGALFAAGRLTAPPGVSPADAADLARHAGDSAVASYRKSVADVIGPLEDSVRYYRGTAQAGARVVVQHPSGAVHDAAPTVQTSANTPAPIDTARLPMPRIDSAGIQIAETLTVAPRPALLQRAIWFAVVPDTVLVALLKTKEGLQRFTAAGTRAGLKVSVADAAAVAPNEHRTLKAALTAATIAGCAVAGYELGRGRDGNGMVTVIGGTVCAGGALIRIRF
ncbi:MAG TPA: hypothetical protein VNG95_02750 [Gemmatimonadales bacterium]|nr:hypothetical protein [Gemmatimonadales bacterium]